MKAPNRHFNIQGHEIGPGNPVYFIADIAANHDGDLARAKNLIHLAANAGANAAKFQHFKADTIVSDRGFQDIGSKQSHQAGWKRSVFEVYQHASLSLDWTPHLKATCEEAGIAFMTSPYSLELVDHVSPFVPAFKIGSGDITWIEMIRHVASRGKPYILASGASTMDDVVRAVAAGLEINPDLCLMQCNTNYTASLENLKFVQLNVLATFRAMYPDLILGLSDHTPGHSSVLGAVALGARVIEKHFTDDVTRIGPDHAFSMDPTSWREMVHRCRELESCLGNGVKTIEQNERETVILQRRAIRLARDIVAGGQLSTFDLEVLRPCPSDGIPPYELPACVGRSVRRSLKKGEHLKWNDLV